MVLTSLAPAKTRVVVSNAAPGATFLFRPEEIGLIVHRLYGPARGKARVDRGGLLWNDRRAPVLVGEAEPAAIALEGANLAGILFDPGVGDFLHSAVADHADKALMEHRISGDVGLAVAQDEGERLHRRGRGARIGDRIGDREHIFVVDSDDALEDEARAVVPGQQHRALGGQRFGVSGPDSVEIGRLRAARTDESRLRPIGVGRAGRREEPDQRALRVNGFAIVLEDEIVDLAALEVDRAAEARRVDGDPRARAPKPD